MSRKEESNQSRKRTMPLVLGEIPFIPPSSVNIQESNPFLEVQIEQCMDHNQRWLYQRLLQVQSEIECRIPEVLLNNSAILVVGSDGRLENAPGSLLISPLEFCILAETDQVATAIDSYLEKLSQENKLLSIYSKSEHKIIGNGNFSGYFGDISKAWPDRILDAAFLAGSSDVVRYSYEKVFEEWITSKKVREGVTGNYKNFFRTSVSGISRNKKHFDRETGEIFFDKEQYIRGLKYGPIRLLQSLLTIRQLNGQIMNAVQETNTVAKLLALYPNATEVAQAYKDALFIYHMQQEKRSLGDSGELTVEPAQLQKILDTITNFCSIEMKKMYPKRD